jgi:hypothetical protein
MNSCSLRVISEVAIPNTIRKATTTRRTVGGFFLRMKLIAKM